MRCYFGHSYFFSFNWICLLFRSSKSHPGPIVHISDNPMDEGKVGYNCRLFYKLLDFFFSNVSTTSLERKVYIAEDHIGNMKEGLNQGFRL